MWVFDIDTHITEEPETWDSLPPRFSSKRLHITTNKDQWRCLKFGRKELTVIHALVQGEFDQMRVLTKTDPLAYEKYLAERKSFPPPGPPFDPRENDVHARVEIMDSVRTSHSVIYPSLGLFWPHRIDDADNADAHSRAWNDWIAARTEGLRDRLLPVAQYSFANPKRAVAEIRRCKKLGLRGLFVQTIPFNDLPWDDPSYEPIWSALEREDLPLLLHFSILKPSLRPPEWNPQGKQRHVGPHAQFVMSRSFSVEAVLTSLIIGGVLERHPRLRIGVIEFGGSWVPSYLHRLEFALDLIAPRNRYLRDRLPLRPIDYFRRQVRVSAFWNEPLEWLIRATGENIFMFGSDYPHPEGNLDAAKLAESTLGTLSAKARRRFFRDNARELFGET